MKTSALRKAFLDYFARQRPPHRVLQPGDRTRRRPHGDVDQRRHGAVQGRVRGQGEAGLHPGHHQPEVPARRRQAQRPGERGLHGPPPHLLRDAGQLQLRRLLQGRRHPLRLGVRHGPQGPGQPGPGSRTASGSPSSRATRASPPTTRPRSCGARSGVPPRPHPALRQEGQLLADGRHRPLRTLLRDALLPRPRTSPAIGPSW